MTNDCLWEFDKLWMKAKVYMQKAFEEDREGEMFPFWATIALEFVARATISRVHPVLLADPREGENLLYVFGFQKKVNFIPISIPTKTVLERCEVIVANFTKNEKDFCLSITSRRNEELHSGGLGFEDYPTKKWLSTYFQVLKILLGFLDKDLKELLGKHEAEAAEEMIKERDTSLEKTVRDRISKSTKTFSELSYEKQTELITNFDKEKWRVSGQYKKEDICPSCHNQGVITGKLISISSGKVGGSEIIQHLNILPTAFKCLTCGLELNSHMELDVIEMGGQYKEEETFDPRDYYDISYEPDFDYGND